MRYKTLTVTSLNKYIKSIINNDVILSNVTVEGEISNLKYHSSGHLYFSIKDENSKITCVMFKSFRERLEFVLDEGAKILAKGYVSIYEKNGQYQLYVNDIKPQGTGDLHIKFEQLKKELIEKGWFNTETKKALPYLPKRIGIVTSSTGAALRDIISVITRRNPKVELYIYPVLVQGSNAKYEISEAIEVLNKHNYVDVIIVGRGGGSIEELWAFNEKVVAESIYNSTIPIISAVGHETDFTISDFVSDLRAPTPSSAAEIVLPSISELKEKICNYNKRLQNGIINNLKNNKEKLDKYKEKYVFKKPFEKIYQSKQQIDNYSNLFKIAIDHKIQEYKYIILNYKSIITNSNQDRILNKGFAIIKNIEDNYIETINNMNKNKDVKIILKDGYAIAKVTEIVKGETNG